MKIAMLTPLPPIRSGIAHYSAMLLRELARRHEVTAVVEQDDVAFDACGVVKIDAFEGASSFDAVICQLGNNVHHEFVWRWARRTPSIVVLHEIVLHHLLVETTLARGDAAGLVAALREECGEAGARVAEARAAGLHGELANFLFPASARVADSARHVIVHNEWARTRLREEGVTAPITVAPHPYDPPPRFEKGEIDAVRRAAGWSAEDRIIGAFGFVTRAKRPEVVMDAFARASRENGSLRLVFVGEPAPDVDLRGLASSFGVPDNIWRQTGFVTDREFDLWMNVVDRVASLRYPTAGEASGPIVRAFAVGRPVAVNDYAQFAELPDALVTRVPFDREVEALADFMTSGSIEASRIGAAQRAWLERTSSAGVSADAYERAIGGPDTRRAGRRAEERLPLFPSIDATFETLASRVMVRLTNRGRSTIVCASWGEPHYVLQTTRVRPDGSRRDEAVRLARDLGPGDSTTVELEWAGSDRLELRHGIAGIPGSDREPFAVLEPRH